MTNGSGPHPKKGGKKATRRKKAGSPKKGETVTDLARKTLTNSVKGQSNAPGSS